MTDKPTRVYANGQVSVDWRPELCIHCGDCVTGLPQVFNLDARPWVNIDGAEPQQIVQQVRNCPSGALSLTPQSQEPA